LSLKEEELIFKENKLNIGHAFRKKNFSNTNNYNNNNNGMGVNNGMGGMGGNGMGGGNPHLHLMNGGNNGFNMPMVSALVITEWAIMALEVIIA